MNPWQTKKPLSTDLLREAFFVLIFWRVGASSPELGVSRPYLKMMCPHLGATRPRVGIAKLGFDAPTWQCRRGDASPPGEDAIPPGEDAPTLQKINTKKASFNRFVERGFFCVNFLEGRCVLT